MIRIGLTGGIGSGKSLVARMLGVLQIPVFDSDNEARMAMKHDPRLREQLTLRFGATIYPKGIFDRKELATVVFNDPEALSALNSLVHPVVRQAFAAWAQQQSAPYVVMESAILVESGGYKLFDGIIVVSAPEVLRIARVMARHGVGEENVRSRIKNQVSESERLAIADHIILNDDRHLVIPQVLELHQEISGGS